MNIVLASASPRRLALLKQLGIDASVNVVDIDETPLPSEAAQDYVLRLAAEKSLAGSQQVNASDWVIGADTCICIDDSIIGKPDDYPHAQAIWLRLSGGWHQVCTAVAVTHQQRTQTLINVNHVCFDTINEEQMRAYWETGEPADKAGGYAIQGLAAAWIQEIRGSYTGIMGLPLFETRQLLIAAGYKTQL
ncbi:Maf-like protein YhdE [BD1-7 clade bacterium]|uniref:dTTP/UTP pyrophosphatase n=1 Tax=BD1-7 clade bacterium TaxID=2029982 RepID=A0A5S9N4Q5_9GAMM|nr:Maf-like protein YhdE [BD1-7 clade bacterium]CAA0084780.1 Maf-like protein YhdE [BD1-7 clade bacterium]